ncbi:MAG: Ig-like domain-containing protein [Deltaproteobacteria bacterium]|nr:Ig-like domain-containing protein [Deltaproteobacteria bacterium]
MRTALLRTTSLLAAAAALFVASPAHAVLQDHGPNDPALTWPLWYRDLNGMALGLCKSQVQSPNPAAGLAPMCFPIAPNPSGFPGNIGDEMFYMNANANLTSGAFELRYVAGLEAAYGNAAGTPARGDEVVFARIRVGMAVPIAGTYTVTHPYGVEVFPDLQPSTKAAGAGASVFFTVDIPLGALLDFDGSLGGRIGPFLQWDFLNEGETLTVGAEQFIGDANYPHTFTGSPFGTNFIRVDGPAGFTGVPGETFLQTPLAVITGQKWTAPIALPLQVERAVYSRNPASGLNTVDVWARSSVGSKLILSGTDTPSLQMKTDGAGNFYAHLEYSSDLVPPSAVTVTNVTSNPVTSRTVNLTDLVNITGATYDPATGALAVTATTSDVSAPPMALSVLGIGGGIMTPSATPGLQTYSGTIQVGIIPPLNISVVSSAGGSATDSLTVGTGNPMNVAGPPVANPDAFTVAGSGATAIDVSANDAFAGTFSVIVIAPPSLGTAVAAASGGTVTYTPALGASGTDSFVYVIQDVTGAVSNTATVTLTVPFVAPPPTASADNFAMVQNSVRTVRVLLNDTAGTGTTIDPASVRISTAPGRGTATANADGTITYRPNAGVNSVLDTFRYTVANTAGTVSAPATVTVDIFGGNESVSISRAQYTASKSAWSIVGSTNWFNAALTQTTASCYLISSGGVAIVPRLIGTAPVDTTGKFQLVPTGATPTPASPAAVNCQTSDPAGTRATSPSASVSFK